MISGPSLKFLDGNMKEEVNIRIRTVFKSIKFNQDTVDRADTNLHALPLRCTTQVP